MQKKKITNLYLGLDGILKSTFQKHLTQEQSQHVKYSHLQEKFYVRLGPKYLPVPFTYWFSFCPLTKQSNPFPAFQIFSNSPHTQPITLTSTLTVPSPFPRPCHVPLQWYHHTSLPILAALLWILAL